MALLSYTDPDSTPRSTLCCDSTVGVYKHSDPEKKGKERRETKDRTRRSGFHVRNQCRITRQVVFQAKMCALSSL